MPLMPHDSWADVYDLAYQRSFGSFYENLTTATLQLVKSKLAFGSRIVDFGAGTGRLTIPLSLSGYRLTAVDPSARMLEQLESKLPPGSKVKTHCSSMADFDGAGYDGALCVFTVLLYLLDEASLKRSLISVHRSLKNGGLLFIDIPSRAIFSSTAYQGDNEFKRKVTVTPLSESVYSYQENILFTPPNGETREFQDEFRIRHWPAATVIETLEQTGFDLIEDVSTAFAGSGSSYFVFGNRQSS